jgi:hypothetical protein
MCFKQLSLKAACLISLIIVVLLFLPCLGRAQFPILEIKVGDTVAYPGQQAVINIYMRNYQDSVVAFGITLLTDHYDVVDFQTAAIDTTGTLISGWELAIGFPEGANGFRIIAFANTLPPPFTPGIGYPQYGDIPLVKILADINPIPDTMENRVVLLYLMDDVYNFNFSDQAGNTIGLSYDSTFDTTWYDCTDWEVGPFDDSTCLGWVKVFGPPADSMNIDTILHPYLDTTKVRIYDGSLELQPYCGLKTGDADCNGNLNILDVVLLINHIYKSGPAPFCSSDCNCDCILNLLDIVCMISNIYVVGMPCECCDCETWNNACSGI